MVDPGLAVDPVHWGKPELLAMQQPGTATVSCGSLRPRTQGSAGAVATRVAA